MATESGFARPGLRAWARAEQGSRKRMEDAWTVSMESRLGGQPGSLFAVFDGLGGEPGGEVAARAASQAFAGAAASSSSLLDALQALNPAVLAGGGCTTAAMVFVPTNGMVDLAWVGDSVGAMLVGNEVQELTSRDKAPDGRLTDFLGNPHLRGHAGEARLPAGSSLALCTDGVEGVVGLRRLRSLLQADAGSVADELDSLFGDIHRLGAPDNATIIVVRRE